MKEIVMGLGIGLFLYAVKLERDYKTGKSPMWTTERVCVTSALFVCGALLFVI